MKKFFSLFLISLVAVMCWSCSDDDDDNTVSDPNAVPQAAQTFLQTYFADDAPVKTTRDAKDGTWDVTLNSGIEVDFDAQGNWTDVEGTLAAPLPNQDFIPAPIRDYVAANYPFQINAISRDARGYEVQLTTLLELDFDPQGNFIGRVN